MFSCRCASDTDRYIQSARLDGAEQFRTYLTTEDIRSARSLSFEVGSEPSAWGTAPADAPPALR
ncbi:hypothetical protein [Streptomyces sp. NBC_00887]|uniref:hypothetical protein n=1 Tax=Streptomyces sp. NBC_00887 TaxID=2975859 RepID=UPI003870B14E|nr:hypothetical protein OG844_13650 [Streptomyces sp. NBC_00887]